MGIGSKIEQNMQLQEFVEKALSYLFEMAKDDRWMFDEIAEEMGTTTEEVYWMFRELGYDTGEEIDWCKEEE